MNAPTPCPDAHALRAFAEGAADAGVAASLKQHLASCAYCRGVAEGLVATRKVSRPGDTGWTEAQRAPADAGTPELTAAFTQEFNGKSREDLPDPAASGDALEPEEEPSDRSATALALSDEDDDELDLSFLLPPVRPDTLGRLGDLDVLGVLGQGGMGVVLKAYDSALNRVVAVKVLAPALAGRSRPRRQFLAEARAAAAINHPNVVTIHDVKIQRGMPYLVMEYLGGQTLRQRIMNGPRLRPLEIVRVALQIARGLAAAHEQGVIHRDVKPGNVMLEDDLERIKITDFGLAQVTHSLTDQSSLDRIIGTPAYMSPEGIHGQTVTERSDLFSLGSVIHAMVTGHSPFHGAQPVDILHKVVSLDPTPLHAINSAIPRPLSLLVTQLLDKDPDRRPPSASAVAAVLNDLLASLQLQGNRPTWNTDSLEIPTFPLPPPSSRTLAEIIQGGTTILVASLLLAMGVLWLSRSDATPRQALGLVGGIDTVAPIPAAPPVLRVGSSSAAKYRTIAAALAAVDRPHTTIQLEPGTYSCHLHVRRNANLEGLTIEPTGAAPRGTVILQGYTTRDATVTVEDVADVTLRGLHFDTPADQFALAVKGSVPGLTIEDVAFLKRPVKNGGSVWSHVWLGRGARGIPGSSITFRRCAFAAWRAGLVLEGNGRAAPISDVEIDTCRFDGGTRMIELIESVKNIHIRRCLFLGGTQGIYLYRLGIPSERVVIDHNTFFRTEYWVDAQSCDPDLEGMEITANALLELPAFDSMGAPLAACRDGGWTITGNHAEGAPTAVGHALVQLSTRLDVTSRDANDPDFLRPSPGSSLIVRGNVSPGFIGALAPSRALGKIVGRRQ